MFVNSADLQTDQLGNEGGVGRTRETEPVVLMSGPPVDLVPNYRACSFAHTNSGSLVRAHHTNFFFFFPLAFSGTASE